MFGLDKKLLKEVMRLIDSTIGKKFPIIDKITDMFQEQDEKIKELEREIEAIKFILKDKNE